MELEEDVKMQSGEDDEAAAAEEDSFDSLHLQHAAGEEEDEDSSDSSWVAYEYRQTSNRCKTLWGRLCSGAPTLALARGTELQTRLSSEHPSFILQLQESHVTKKFFLVVPVEFCKLHLPAHTVEVTLEDEKGESYSVNFHPGTVQNLIIGWKKFAVAHKLLEDDVIVFHLLKPCFFKVYIIVANEPIIVACANRTCIDVHANEGNKGRNSEATDEEIPDLYTVQQGVKRSSSLSSPNIEPGQDHSSTDGFHTSDMMEAFPLSNCDADSEGHKRLGNVGVLAREEKGDSSNSSGMVILKPPSVENHVAVCSKRALRLHRKKSYKQVGYENQQTIKRWLTKTQRMDSEACALALERAKELQTNLSSEHPSFIKQMHPSNVNGKGLLAVPMEFCRLHLPNHDSEVTLEDENGESYIVKFVPTYIIRLAKFIAGWKRFSDAHKLLASDTVVFQLLRPCYFKVYIIRVSDLAGSTDLKNFNVNANKGKDAPHLDTDQGCVKRCSMLSNPSLKPVLDHSSTDEFHSSEMEASPSSKCDSDFEVHKHLDNLEVRAREVKDLPASSCMETSKPPSVENNIPVSRLSRKKTYKQVGYENQQTIKRWPTKTRRMDSEACALALERAKELQTNLSSEHPSFMKQMHPSNVNGKARLAVPKAFNTQHLPKHDAEVTLEDENGESYIVKFSPNYYTGRFSAGWKWFSNAHKLLASDTVVFHLLRPCYFKVYIIRASELIGNKGKKRRKCDAADRKGPGLAPHLDTTGGSVKGCSFLSNPSLYPGLDHSIRDEFHSSDMEASRLSKHDAAFEGHKHLDNLEVQVRGEKEKDSPASSSMVTSKAPYQSHHMFQNNIPVSRKGIIKLSRKKTHKKVAYVNQKKVRRWLTKRRRMDSEACALERAKELQTKLSSEHPSFIKQLFLSELSNRYIMSVPVEFYRLHLPNNDAEITLEDENGVSYIVKFFPAGGCRPRFIGGWKSFTDAHNLIASDIAVFHLLRPCYFKVYIIRANVNANKGKKKTENVNQQTIKCWLTKRRRIDSDACALALERAMELRTNLSSEHPSFIKQIRTYHVNVKAALGVPMEFCRLHLPNHDAKVTLEDENGQSYIVKFVLNFTAHTARFCAGWKRFSNAHKLLASDTVVFQLLRPCYFKVYIIRFSDLTGSTDLTNSNVNANKGKDAQGCVKRCSMLSNHSLEPGLDHSIRDGFHSSEMEASPSSKCDSDILEVLAREVKEKDSPASSCMVGYENQQTIKRWLTKRQRKDSEACALTLERAKELQTNLSSENPSFIKKIHTSNVNGNAALAVPMEFCRLHLPNHDAEVILEDENGEIYIVKFVPTYIIHIAKFIAGWKSFVDAHKLLASDTVVFQLLRPCYFKVYIIRSSLLLSNPSLEPGWDHSSTKKSQSSSDIQACTFSGHDSDFENFKIIVNGEIVDPELPRLIRFKYYELCCSQKSFLHHKLLRNVNPALAAGIITGTLEVEEAIRSYKLSTSSKDDFATWDSTLEGFKNLGMEVGFLRQRLKVVRDALRGPQDHDVYFDQPFGHDSDFEACTLSGNDSDFEACTLSGHDSDFEACTLSGNDSDFENFKIIVNGEIVDDPELPRSSRLKYYELCCSQKSFLHHKLLKNVNPALAAGIITGTLEVEEAIRSCKLSTSKDDFATWDSTLEGFKNLGMEVRFLRERLKVVQDALRGPQDHDAYFDQPFGHDSDFEACTLSGNDSDFENFKIIVNGEIVDDPELPRSIRFKYYELCCSQKSFLHHKLLRYVNPTLAAGIITGTLEVEEAIRSCKLSTSSKDDFATWDSTLEGFKNLGMEVGFLREQLKGLARIESESRESEKFKRYKEVIKEERQH